MKRTNRDLTEGSIAKSLIRLTAPMILGIVSMIAFNLVDTYFVSQLGETQLAALTFTFPVIMLIFSLVQGIAIGATALIARSIGKNDRQKAARETTDSLLLAILLAGIFVILGLVFMKPLFRLMGATESIMPYVLEYMTIWFVAIMFVIVPFVGNSAIRSTGDANTPTIIMLLAVGLNAALDPILIFGYGVIPAMGLKGAAYATAISRIFTFIVAFYILMKREKLITLDWPGKAVVWNCWKAILYIGLPSGFSRMVNPIGMSIVTALIAGFGKEAVAAYGVGTRIEFLALAVYMALGASIGPFTGQNLGAFKFERIQKGLNQSSVFSILWGLSMALIFSILADPIAGIFTDNESVREYVVWYLRIIPLGFGFQGINMIVNANLNTMNKPIPASILLVGHMFLIYIPLVYAGAQLYDMKGIFFGICAAYILGGFISFILNQKISRITFRQMRLKPS